MILRILNFVVIGMLVLAAAYVYRIKFNSTVQAEHLAKLRTEVRHERDNIAALRAKWGELDNPTRIEALAKRYLQLKPIAPTQFDTLDQLPDRAGDDATPSGTDPIGGIIENLEVPDTVTGSVTTATSPPSGVPSGAPVQVPAATAAAGGGPSR